MQLKNDIKLDDLEYTAKRGTQYSFSKYSSHIVIFITYCF